MGMSNVEWWDPPRKIMVELEPHQIKPMPLGHDTFIVMEFGGRQFDALIPSSMGYRGQQVCSCHLGRKEWRQDHSIFPSQQRGTPHLVTDRVGTGEHHCLMAGSSTTLD